MADARTVAGLRRVAERLRARGIRVEMVPGWERRGKGPMRPLASVEHHTASRRGGDWGALLRLLTYGHGNLDNSVCNWGVPANGHAAYLVCAGLAYHAGKGSWRGVTGNSRASGTEWQNDGIGEPAQPAAVEIMAAIDQEMAREFGYPHAMVCEHFEWTGRKVDRRAPGLPVGQAWRDRLDRPAHIDEWETFMATLTPEEQDALRGVAQQIVREGTNGASMVRQFMIAHRARTRAGWIGDDYAVLAELRSRLNETSSSVRGLVRGAVAVIRAARHRGWQTDPDAQPPYEAQDS